MTECISTKLSFSSLKRQEIVGDFCGGRLTSDGGALLLREVDRRLGLTIRPIRVNLYPQVHRVPFMVQEKQ